MNWGQLGADLLKIGIGTAVDFGTNAYNTKKQEEMAQEARRQNYQYAEASAESAFNRQQKLLREYYTPQAQMQQLQDAGLSPSLMYGGEGTTGTTTAPQGQGSMGIPTEYTPLNPLMGAQVANLMADANLKESQAEKTDIEATGEKLKNDWQTIQNRIAEATESGNIEKVFQEVDVMKKQAELYMSQKALNDIDFDFKSESFQSRLDQESKKVEQITADILLKGMETQVAEKERDFIAKQIQGYKIELYTKLGQLKVAQDNVEVQRQMNQIYKECNDNFVKTMRDNAVLMAEMQKRGQNMDLIGDIVGDLFDVGTTLITGGLSSIAKGVGKTLVKKVKHVSGKKTTYTTSRQHYE